jgi:hypothetical protein
MGLVRARPPAWKPIDSLEMSSFAGFDPAVSLAQRLQRECRAYVVDVDALPQGVTIQLAIPRSGLIPMHRLRRDLWMAFVSRSVQTRRDEVAKVRLRVASQWEALGRSRAMTEHNRALLTQRSSA